MYAARPCRGSAATDLSTAKIGRLAFFPYQAAALPDRHRAQPCTFDLTLRPRAKAKPASAMAENRPIDADVSYGCKQQKTIDTMQGDGADDGEITKATAPVSAASTDASARRKASNAISRPIVPKLPIAMSGRSAVRFAHHRHYRQEAACARPLPQAPGDRTGAKNRGTGSVCQRAPETAPRPLRRSFTCRPSRPHRRERVPSHSSRNRPPRMIVPSHFPRHAYQAIRAVASIR